MSKALVTLLNGETFSNVATAAYARDVELNLESVSTPKIYVDGTVAHARQSRATWSRSVTLNVIAVSPQEQRGDSALAAVENEKDAWLAFIDDELIAVIQAATVSGKKPVAIEFEQRMDPDKVREHSLFWTKFQINFPIV